MKKILVLGGFGFIGTNLLSYIDKFELNNYEVFVFDRKGHSRFGINFKCVKKVYTGDFTDKEKLALVFNENSIDEVFHFLNTTVPATSSNIKFDIESNLISTVNLLELVKEFKVKKIIFLSSGGAIYNQSFSSSESADAWPLSSYGIVKLAIEKYIAMVCTKHNLSYLILRLSNVYGLYHQSNIQGIVNIAIKKAIANETITVWGNGNGKKDYIFVEDFIEILMLLLHKEIANETINVGSGKLYSINEILQYVKIHAPTLVWKNVEKKEFDNESFYLDIHKLRSLIDQYEFTPIEVGIKKIWQWLM